MSKINDKSKVQTPFLYLVSKSPRRYDLLNKAGYQFEALSIEISEIIDKNLNGKEQCLGLARLKMRHFLGQNEKNLKENAFALTCDTMVEFEGLVLGKPLSRDQAKGWIKSYENKSQWVHTGCSLVELGNIENRVDWVTSTKINFSDVGEEALNAYFDKTPDYITKAGGYGLQDEYFNFVESIEGSYTNVVGLPLEDLSVNFLKLVEKD